MDEKLIIYITWPCLWVIAMSESVVGVSLLDVCYCTGPAHYQYNMELTIIDMQGCSIVPALYC